MFIFIIFGSIFFIFSVLFFFTPKFIIKISEMGNKLIFTDHGTVAHRYWSGIFLLIMSIIMFYLGWQ